MTKQNKNKRTTEKHSKISGYQTLDEIKQTSSSSDRSDLSKQEYENEKKPDSINTVEVANNDEIKEPIFTEQVANNIVIKEIMIQPIEKNNEVKLTIYSLLPGDQEIVKRTKVALVNDHQKYEDTEYGIKFYPHYITEKDLHDSFVTRLDRRKIFNLWFQEVVCSYHSLLRVKNWDGKKAKIRDAEIELFLTKFNMVWKAVKEGIDA